MTPRRDLVIANLARGRLTDFRAVNPNVARFYEQAQSFKTLLASAAPDAEQQKDLDFPLNVGHLFSLIVYGQLILEQAALTGVDDDIVDQIFDFLIRDFDTYAVALQSKPTSTQAQQDWAGGAIRKPVPDAERFNRVWDRVKAYDGAYQMRPRCVPDAARRWSGFRLDRFKKFVATQIADRVGHLPGPLFARPSVRSTPSRQAATPRSRSSSPI